LTDSATSTATCGRCGTGRSCVLAAVRARWRFRYSRAGSGGRPQWRRTLVLVAFASLGVTATFKASARRATFRRVTKFLKFFGERDDGLTGLGVSPYARAGRPPRTRSTRVANCTDTAHSIATHLPPEMPLRGGNRRDERLGCSDVDVARLLILAIQRVGAPCGGMASRTAATHYKTVAPFGQGLGCYRRRRAL
jgi:hypothetical protein